jgi:hypothetical protein
MKGNVLLGLMLFLGAGLFGQNAADFQYDLDRGAVTITGYTGNAKNVTIPARLAGLPVMYIGRNAFEEMGLTGVTIPDGVVEIADWAFYRNQLADVAIPDSVTHIGMGAFSENRLARVTIGKSVVSIGKWGFDENRLTSVTIPDSVTVIGENAFENNQLTQLAIGNGVVSIGNSAFDYNPLTSVIIPNSVASIGTYAFDDIPLTSITIGANVEIADDSFCGNFEDVYIQSGPRAGTYLSSDGGNTWIWAAALSGSGTATGTVAPARDAGVAEQAADFRYETGNGTGYTVTGYTGNAQHVTIPARIGGRPVTAIGNDAFDEKGLTGVTIPDGVTAIGEWAFHNNQLTGITIPRSVTTVGDYAFYKNPITGITIGANVATGRSAFGGNFADVYARAGKTAGTYRSADGGRTWRRQ